LLTSKTGALPDVEFGLTEWAVAGFNISTALKRGIYAVHESLVIKELVSRLTSILSNWKNPCLDGWI
jgi:mRNA interferase MazF